MKLLALKVGGFGGLKGDFKFDPDRVTLIVDENERGKSTLLAAITAALYGLEDDRRSHRVITPVERWRPWGGGAYRVELELEHGNERLTIRRDFERGTVEVWTAHGKEVTERYRSGKDTYPVGQHLLGLNVWEFEKCALVRQGELEQVVPTDEKGRRSSTLHARLESAADTTVGDTNATEAVQVLETAASSYTSAELGSTMKIENAIQRLEVKRALIESEARTLEHDLEKLSGPFDELARFGEEEQQVRAALTRLDGERRESLASDVRRKLAENDDRRRELQELRAEASKISGDSNIPANAEPDLRETVARLEEAQRNLESLDARRHEEQARERGELLTEMEGLKAYAACSSEEADKFVATAAEIRRIAEEDSKLRTSVFELRDSLAGQGHLPERMQLLASRFKPLTDAQQKLLRGQSEIQLAFQTNVADLEKTRTSCTETLREVDAQRNARRTPGWLLLALGLGSAIAGVALLALKLSTPVWVSLLASGTLILSTGGALLATGARLRELDREAALRGLSEAQRKLNQLRAQRAETERALNEMTRAMGYRDTLELIRDWTEYSRLSEESTPVMRAQEQLVALEEQRKQVLADVRVMLERAGGGSPDPAHLERVAAGIRHHIAVRQRLAEMEKSWSWIDEEKRVAEASATGLKERAARILQTAGVPHDPSRSWPQHVAELAERVRGRSRHATLVDELIPQAERRLLPDKEVAELKSQLDLLEAEGKAGGGGTGGGGEGTAGARGQAEIDVETRKYREALDEVQKKRADLRLQVEETWRKHHAEHPEKLSELERIDHAIEQARRFKLAVETACETIRSVAQETHRRWADHLNQRVSEMLRTMGTTIEQLRFGEDLDFSLKFENGQQASRGRALMHLSSGARDQVHLAVRLAISEYLSRGQMPAPLLIDDAFASSDDERARSGMRLLLEHLSKRHQVIFVTCHRGRYESLAEKDRDLYGSRVHWLDTRATSPAK